MIVELYPRRQARPFLGSSYNELSTYEASCSPDNLQACQDANSQAVLLNDTSEAHRLEIVYEYYAALAAQQSGDLNMALQHATLAWTYAQNYGRTSDTQAQSAKALMDSLSAQVSNSSAIEATVNAEPAARPPASAPAPAPAPAETGDAAIATQTLSWTSSIGMPASTYASWKAQVMQALSAGILDPGGQYASSTGKCSGSSAPAGASDLQDAATALGVATTGATVGALIASASSVIPIIGIVGSVTGLFIALFSKLFGPPVSQLEQHTLCPAVSAANAILKQITAELKAGYITESQAASAITELVSSFNSQVSSIEYVQTPNDTQLMMSELQALQIKNTSVTYPQLGQSASSALAAQQAALQQAQQSQIDQAVQSAVAKAVPVAPAAAPASIPASGTPSVTSAPAPAASAAPSPLSWFSASTQVGSLNIPNWAFLVGGGLLLMAAEL